MEKICTLCGQPGKFHKTKATADGLSRKCAKCTKKYHAIWYRKNRPERLAVARKWAHKNRESLAYSTYKRMAARRGLEFELSMDQFMSFWGQPCFYTGREIHGIGLDRIDNSKGYVIGNIVPCCFAANKAKMQMSHNDFVKLCEEVAQRHGHRNKPVSTKEANVFHDVLFAAV